LRDVAGYGTFMRKAEAIYRVGFEQLGAVPFTSLSDMVKVLPDFVRLESYRSVHGLVAKHARDPRLRFALSFHPLFIGGNPFNVTAVYGLIAFLERRFGVHFPMGGIGRLVQALGNLIERKGHDIRYDAEVSEITVANRTATGARLASGERIKSDIVVSNADMAWCYRNLLPNRAARR